MRHDDSTAPRAAAAPRGPGPRIARRSLPVLRAAAFAGALAAVLPGCALAPPAADARPPIVFVHGNGDSAALWGPTMWRFESNGWPRDRLHAIDVPYPLARDVDAVAQAGRTSSAENRDWLAAEVERVLARTGASRVVLVGNSRGGYAIRDYVRNAGGAAKVSHAILGGAPNRGVWSRPDFSPGSEFNGAGPFLTALNSPQGPGGEQVTPAVRWLTLRSDALDKYAQPTGEWIGQPKLATNVGADGPALAGAVNTVLPGLDHREVSYHPRAFAETWRFVVGSPPATLAIVPEPRVVLDGLLAAPAGVSNLPLTGARLEVFEVACASGERGGGPAHARTVGADGRWGPFATRPDACLEFVVAANGFPVTHVYRAPFPRSSSVVHLRPVRLADADRGAGSVVTMTRPRGYFGLGRDTMSLDGKPLPGVGPGVPGVAAARLVLPAAAPRTVVAQFNGERVAARSWPVADGHVAVAELHE